MTEGGSYAHITFIHFSDLRYSKKIDEFPIVAKQATPATNYILLQWLLYSHSHKLLCNMNSFRTGQKYSFPDRLMVEGEDRVLISDN